MSTIEEMRDRAVQLLGVRVTECSALLHPDDRECIDYMERLADRLQGLGGSPRRTP